MPVRLVKSTLLTGITGTEQHMIPVAILAGTGLRMGVQALGRTALQTSSRAALGNLTRNAGRMYRGLKEIGGRGFQRLTAGENSRAQNALDNMIEGMGYLSAAKEYVYDPITALTSESALLKNQSAIAGVSQSAFEGWTDLAGEFGQEPEKIMNMMASLNDRFGEAERAGRPTAEMEEALRMLNLEYGQLRKLTPEQRFLAILRAVQISPYQEQQLVSGVSPLLGGEVSRALIRHVMRRRQPLSDTFGTSVEGIVKQPVSPTDAPLIYYRHKEPKQPKEETKPATPELGKSLKTLHVSFKDLAIYLPDIVLGFEQLAKQLKYQTLREKRRKTGKLDDDSLCSEPRDKPRGPCEQKPKPESEPEPCECKNEDDNGETLSDLVEEYERNRLPEKKGKTKGRKSRSATQHIEKVIETLVENMPVTMNIYQQPGESSAELAGQIGDELQNRLGKDQFGAAGDIA